MRASVLAERAKPKEGGMVNMSTRIGSVVVAVASALLIAAGPSAALATGDDVKQVPISGAESYVPVPAEGVIFCTGLPDPMYRVFDSHGRFTHLGQTSTVLTTDACELTAAGLVLDGHATRTAADGDQLYASFHDTIDPASGTDTGQAIFTGGTGRFAGATGSGTFAGTIDLVTLEGAFTFTGTISSVGSSQ
jgi:hypothetical protein